MTNFKTTNTSKNTKKEENKPCNTHRYTEQHIPIELFTLEIYDKINNLHHSMKPIIDTIQKEGIPQEKVLDYLLLQNTTHPLLKNKPISEKETILKHARNRIIYNNDNIHEPYKI